MLAACAARLADKKDLVWVDLGGGTGVSHSPPQIPSSLCIQHPA